LGISVITILSAIDFWYTKNIAGRLLVGLLWEREILPTGKEEFLFQCNGDENKNNKVDSFFFWMSQYISTGFWVLNCLFHLFTFSSKVSELLIEFLMKKNFYREF